MKENNMNIIKFSKLSLKQLIKIPSAVKILDKIDLMKCTSNFSKLDIKKLKNIKYQYRLRVGEYRVLFDMDENYNIKIITIKEVKKRNERTY